MVQVGPKLGPKIIENRSRGLLKSDHIFDWLWGRVLLPFGANLVPTWPPEASQYRPKLAPKSIKKSIKILTQIFFDF